MKTLRDGIPLLIRNISVSSPSIPLEGAHAPCDRIVSVMPYQAEVTEQVLNAANVCWRTVKEGQMFYGSEFDIVYIARMFLDDILAALKLRLDFCAEVTIKRFRPDLCVLLLDGRFLVGVVEVKKPGHNIMTAPTVLGELFDQMMLLEGFYGTGPVIGILTTAVEWMVSWFPADSKYLGSFQHL